MKAKVPDVLEKGRIKYADPAMYLRGEWYGDFVVRCPATGTHLRVITALGDPGLWASCGFRPPAFDHVSVSHNNDNQLPTWDEMNWVKDLCFEPEECVIQYHPPKSVYVNRNPKVLHLWRPVGVDIPLPPKGAIG